MTGKPKKKILFLNSCVHGGGAGKSLDTYFRYACERIEKYVVVPERGTMVDSFTNAVIFEVPEFVERIERCPWKWMSCIKSKWVHILFNLFALPIAVCKIYRICKQVQPEILYANHMLANPVALVLGWLTKVPVYFHQRNIHHYPVEMQFYRWMGTCKIVRKIICNSNASALLFLEHSEDKVSVVYNCVRDDQYDVEDDIPAQLDQEKEDGSFVFGYMGRIIPIKGVQVFLDALINVVKESPLAKGLLVGGNDPGLHSDLLASYRKQIENQGLQDRIVFTGYQSDVRPFISKMDMLVVPTQWPEPFGRVFIEAMAYKVPSMTTAWGGAIEVIEDGKNGLWFVDGEGLEKSMHWCLEHKREVQGMQDCAKKILRKYYLASENAKLLDALILDTVAPEDEELAGYLKKNREKAIAFENDRMLAFKTYKNITTR